MELLCKGIVGIILKTSDSPENVNRRVRPALLASQSTELWDVSIGDLKRAEVVRKGLAVKLRIGSRAWHVSDIDDELDLVGAKQLDKFRECAPGMSDKSSRPSGLP